MDPFRPTVAPARRLGLALLGAAAALAWGPAPAAAKEKLDYRRVLSPYVGTWAGSFRVSNARSGAAARHIRVEQEYKWNGAELKGIAVFEERGQLTFAQMRIFVKNSRLHKELIYGENKPAIYVGTVRGSTITWIPTDLHTAIRLQTIETIQVVRGRSLLTVQHMERPQKKGVSARIFRGTLSRK